MPVVAQYNGRRMFRFRSQLFGAKGGLVHIFDERDGTRSVCDPDEFLARAEALGREAAYCIYADERKELIDAANDMEACAAEAAAQGNPLDPKVQAYYARHKRRNSILGTDIPPLSDLLRRDSKLTV